VTALPPLPASNVLLGGRTLLLLPTLVGMVGLNEAIVLQQVRYRLGDDLRPHVHEGRRWARDPLERWRERDFPFWEIDTLRRAFQSLEARGLLHAAQFDKHLRDRTKSYTIDFDALAARERDYRAARTGTPPPRGRTTASGRRGGQRGGDGMVAETALPPLPANDLLIDEPPLIIVVNLATAIGLDEALILQQIRYWLADERRPQVRDGRRWVCPREVGLLVPLAFRSAKTLARALRRLEHLRLIVASERYNRLPGDRTKWYSIDFANVALLVAAPEGQNAAIQPDSLPFSTSPDCPIPSGQSASAVRSNLPGSMGTECFEQQPILPASLKDSETDPKTEQREQQQECGVVVASLLDTQLQELLVARGITFTTARALAHTHAAVIARQVDIFDWLRDADRDDQRLTAGRLRKMIEEDWAAPPHYVPRPEREAQAAAAHARSRRSEEEHDAATIMYGEHAADAQRRRRLVLEQLGLREEDQGLWSTLLTGAADCPRFLREALFYPPSRESPIAAIIFPVAAGAARAKALPLPTRRRLARRIAVSTKLPTVELWLCDQAEIRALLDTPADALVPNA